MNIPAFFVLCSEYLPEKSETAIFLANLATRVNWEGAFIRS